MRRKRDTLKSGRTRPGRLALLDRLFEASLFNLPASGHAIDLGYGDEPLTTLDWASTCAKRGSPLKFVGVENDAARVQAAQELFGSRGISFCEGSFDLRPLKLDRISVIRCMNVLRGYPLESVKTAQIAMLNSLAAGGLLIEGSTDTEGHLLSAHLWRRLEEGATYEGLLMVTDFKRGFSPRMFRDVLPRDVRRHVKLGEPVFEFLEHFEALTSQIRTAEFTLQEIHHRAGKRLEGERSDTLGGDFLEHGAICWQPEKPSARPEVLHPGLDILDR